MSHVHDHATMLPRGTLALAGGLVAVALVATTAARPKCTGA